MLILSNRLLQLTCLHISTITIHIASCIFKTPTVTEMCDIAESDGHPLLGEWKLASHFHQFVDQSSLNLVCMWDNDRSLQHHFPSDDLTISSLHSKAIGNQVLKLSAIMPKFRCFGLPNFFRLGAGGCKFMTAFDKSVSPSNVAKFDDVQPSELRD